MTFILSRCTCLPGARGNRTLQIFFRGFCSFPTRTVRPSLTECWAADTDLLGSLLKAKHPPGKIELIPFSLYGYVKIQDLTLTPGPIPVAPGLVLSIPRRPGGVKR